MSRHPAIRGRTPLPALLVLITLGAVVGSLTPWHATTLAASAPGGLVVWGENEHEVASVPAGMDFTAISAGSSHALALRSDGSIVGWGSNSFGQANVPAGTGYLAIAAGDDFSLALRDDHTIAAWGQRGGFAGADYAAIAANGYNSLALRADGSLVGYNAPAGNDYTAIAAGFCHSLALREDGSIVGWYARDDCDFPYGQQSPPAGNDYVAIGAGWWHSLALRSDGSIVGWGWDREGQASPPAGNDYVAIAAGHNHSLALRSDGSIVGWGYNQQGQASPPVGTGYTAIAADGNWSLAISTGPFPSDTTTTLMSDHNPSVFGQPVSFTATVAPTTPDGATPSGDVTFTVDGIDLPVAALDAQGVAQSPAVAYLTPGDHQINAAYAGDALFNGSTSRMLPQYVTRAATTTALTSDVNPSWIGQPVTFTATVSAVAPGAGTPSGTVQLLIDGQERGLPMTLENGSTTSAPMSQIGAGEHTIGAVYSGDDNFGGSSSAGFVQTVSADQASADPGPGGTVETGGGSATPSDPTTTAVTTPTGGTVTITESPAGTPPTGYVLVGQAIDISAPGATPTNPLRILFRIDSSVVPVDESASTVKVFRDGALVADCSSPGSGQAVPSPCVEWRETMEDEDIRIHVLTATASTWATGFVSETALEPDTAITSGPPLLTNDSTPTFAFTSDTPGAVFECRVDQSEFSLCSAPHTTAPLSDGAHRFDVRALVAGVADTSPATRAFTVHTEAPQTTEVDVSMRVGGSVNSGPVVITWQASDALTPVAQLRHQIEVRRMLANNTWCNWGKRITVTGTHWWWIQPQGLTYQYRVRSRDAAHNWGAWLKSEPVLLRGRQEHGFTFSDGWSFIRDAQATKHDVARSSSPDATARLRFTGHGVALVMPAHGALGTLQVCLDPGTSVEQCATVNLGGFRPAGDRRLVAVFDGLPRVRHVLLVTVVSGTVDLDAALVSK